MLPTVSECKNSHYNKAKNPDATVQLSVEPVTNENSFVTVQFLEIQELQLLSILWIEKNKPPFFHLPCFLLKTSALLQSVASTLNIHVNKNILMVYIKLQKEWLILPNTLIYWACLHKEIKQKWYMESRMIQYMSNTSSLQY